MNNTNIQRAETHHKIEYTQYNTVLMSIVVGAPHFVLIYIYTITFYNKK
jgi:hypothetical protein